MELSSGVPSTKAELLEPDALVEVVRKAEEEPLFFVLNTFKTLDRADSREIGRWFAGSSGSC